jgi:hypothetical protein
MNSKCDYNDLYSCHHFHHDACTAGKIHAASARPRTTAGNMCQLSLWFGPRGEAKVCTAHTANACPCSTSYSMHMHAVFTQQARFAHSRQSWQPANVVA